MKRLLKITSLFIIVILIFNILIGVSVGTSNSRSRASKPILTNAGVNPTTGNTSTLFTFSVVYKDADGDMPMIANVIIDNVYLNLTWNSSNAKTGINMTYSTKLSAGNYSYYFYVENMIREYFTTAKKNISVKSGSGSGSNKPPVLYNQQYSPSRPTANQTIKFSVMYKDEDNDVPNFVQLEIKKNNGTWNIYNMTINGTLYSNGVVCYKSLNLSSGYYIYRFRTIAKNDTVLTKELSLYVAPGTSNNPPVLSGGSVTPLNGTANKTMFKYNVCYQDGNYGSAKLSFVHINNKKCTMKEEKGDAGSAGIYYSYSTTLQTGNYTYYFLFSNGKVNVTLPSNGTFIGPYVFGSNPPSNRPPNATISVSPRVGNINTTFYFNGTGKDPDGDTLKYSWTFNDINTIIWQQNATRKYSRAGNYSATLTVSDGSLKDSATATVMVTSSTNPPPKNNPPVIITNLRPNNYVKKGVTMGINALKSYDPDKDKLTFNWTVISANSASPASYQVAAFNYTFSIIGNYTFKLSVSDGQATTNGVYLFLCNNNTSTNQKPVARASVTVRGMIAMLSGAGSYDLDGRIVSYSWMVDKRSYSGKFYNHTYSTYGYKTVTLSVKDDGGLSDWTVIGFYIGNRTNSSNRTKANYNLTNIGSHVEVEGEIEDGNVDLKIINSEFEFFVSLLESRKNYLKFLIESDSPTGRLVIIDIKSHLLDLSNLGLIELTMDNSDVEFTDFEDVVNANDDKARYYIMQSEDQNQLLIYIPHFSEHIIELQVKDESTPDNTDEEYNGFINTNVITWPILLIFAIIVVIIVLIVFQEIRKKKDKEFYYDFRVAEEKTTNGIHIKNEKEEDENWDDFI